MSVSITTMQSTSEFLLRLSNIALHHTNAVLISTKRVSESAFNWYY